MGCWCSDRLEERQHGQQCNKTAAVIHNAGHRGLCFGDNLHRQLLVLARIGLLFRTKPWESWEIMNLKSYSMLVVYTVKICHVSGQ